MKFNEYFTKMRNVLSQHKNKEVKIHVLRRRLRSLRKILNQGIIGHRDMIDALLLGLIAKEHVG